MKAYTIIMHKSKKPRLQLFDKIVFEKKADAKKYLEDILKDIKKEDKSTYYKDSETYIVTENKTGDEYDLFIQELYFRK